jgi:formylmethanofuran dehydrogenase subunit E
MNVKINPSPVWCRDGQDNTYTWEESLDLIRQFHGHTAPGLAIGVTMVSLALEQMEAGTLFDVICETRSCLPDAIQMLTPCTIGNGWLKIRDLGRYALVMYDKFTGQGVRVFIDPAKLAKWPEFHHWFYKTKPKNEQHFNLLLNQIKGAGQSVLGIQNVRTKSQYLVKQSKGAIRTCPVCGEAYPLSQGKICLGCRGDAVIETDHGKHKDSGPRLKAVPAAQALGQPLLHDMTRIIPGREKGALFHRGQVLGEVDLCRLQKMGRNRVYVDEPGNRPDGFIHEDAAAQAFAKAMAGSGIGALAPPREGKITLTALTRGMLVVGKDRLRAFNRTGSVMAATLTSHTLVAQDTAVAATRAIPLYLPEHEFAAAMAALEAGPILQVLPLKKANLGILVTGTEVFQGLVKDRFIPVIQAKAEQYHCKVVKSLVVPDHRGKIAKGIAQLLDAGADFIVTTAGLSVDPEDFTRQGLADAGCRDMLYGSPVLPGAMTLIAGIDTIPVLGVPACGLHHEITSFDLLFPRLLAGLTINREDLAELGHGGFCRNCKICSFPHCPFGQG